MRQVDRTGAEGECLPITIDYLLFKTLGGRDFSVPVPVPVPIETEAEAWPATVTSALGARLTAVAASGITPATVARAPPS